MANNAVLNPGRRLSSRRMHRLEWHIALYIVLGLGAFVALLPFLYLIANSLKTYSETVTRVSAIPFSPRFWPKQLQWNNYKIVWLEGEGLGRNFVNSVIISLTTTSGILVTSSLAAFGYSKINFAGKNLLFSIMLATLMIPETVLLIPNFITVSAFGWVDRLPALTIPFMASAFFIFLLRQFFNQVPNSLMESAIIDGASYPRILVSLFLPLSKAPMFTVGFLAFTGSWNALQWPLVVTQTPKWRPIAVGLIKFITEAGPETQLRMAGATIALLPVMFVYFLAQRQITEAITQTGLKG